MKGNKLKTSVIAVLSACGNVVTYPFNIGQGRAEPLFEEPSRKRLTSHNTLSQKGRRKRERQARSC